MRPLRVGRPIWLGRNLRSGTQTYDALKGDYDADVAIVGGGMTGALVAQRFANAGVGVALLEAALVGRGSTAASTALLLRETDAGLRGLERRYGTGKARR